MIFVKFLYETHLHTSESSRCGVTPGAEMARQAKAMGYAGIIVTDHFITGGSSPVSPDLPWEQRVEGQMAGYEACRAEGERIGLQVLFGWEFPYCYADLLTYGLDKQWLLDHPDLPEWPIERYFQEVKEAGGMVIQAHPYRVAWWIKDDPPLFDHLVDAIEVYNSHNPNEDADPKAMALAQKRGLLMTAGSDAHQAGQLFGWGVAFDHKLEDERDLVRSLKDPATYELVAHTIEKA